MNSELPHSGQWTIADVEDIPDYGTGNRYEILGEGVLTINPAPTAAHQSASQRLVDLLKDGASAVGDHVTVFEAINVVLPGDLLTVPDIVVVRGTFETTRCPADKVLLAVEITTQSGQLQDELLKPLLYAEAGIPHFWRLELKSARLYTYQLANGQYDDEQVFTTTTRVTTPFPVTITPSTLVNPQQVTPQITDGPGRS